MRFFSCISQEESSTTAVEQVIEQANAAMKGKIDAAFVFLTAHHVGEAEQILERLWLELDPQTIVGCSGEGVIGDDKEIERSPGLALLVGEMPGVRLHPFHIAPEDWRALISEPDQL